MVLPFEKIMFLGIDVQAIYSHWVICFFFLPHFTLCNAYKYCRAAESSKVDEKFISF